MQPDNTKDNTAVSKWLPVIEGNRLIADFMGERLVTPDLPLTTSLYPMIIVENGLYKQTHYHDKWDWLIPVVEKIEACHYKGFPLNVNIAGAGILITINQSNAAGQKYEGKKEVVNTLNCNYFNDYEGAEQISKIKSVWNGVVQFIKWYNKQQPTPKTE